MSYIHRQTITIDGPPQVYIRSDEDALKLIAHNLRKMTIINGILYIENRDITEFDIKKYIDRCYKYANDPSKKMSLHELLKFEIEHKLSGSPPVYEYNVRLKSGSIRYIPIHAICPEFPRSETFCIYGGGTLRGIIGPRWECKIRMLGISVNILDVNDWVQLRLVRSAIGEIRADRNSTLTLESYSISKEPTAIPTFNGLIHYDDQEFIVKVWNEKLSYADMMVSTKGIIQLSGQH